HLIVFEQAANFEFFNGLITMEKGWPRYSEGLCEGCCGCLNICPQDAWRDSWFATKFFNKGMYVREMVTALRKK
ncbi:MAG: hypothetical protein ACLFOY_15340, partial [Desulfatibacillaceae bacterium]